MKSVLKILALLLLTLTANGSSQLVRGYGIKAGAALAGQDWSYSVPVGNVASQTRWGVHVGPFVEFLNIPVLSVLVEAHYVQKGFSEELLVTTESSPEGIGTRTLSPRIDYLSVPLLAKARLDVGPVSPYVVAGPRFDILLSTKPDGYDAILNHIKSSDFGLTAGAGVEWAVTPSIRIGAEGRFSPGFQDVFNTPLLKVRNHSFEFLATISMH